VTDYKDFPDQLDFRLIEMLERMGVTGIHVKYPAAQKLIGTTAGLHPNYRFGVPNPNFTRLMFGALGGVSLYYEGLRYHMREVAQLCAWDLQRGEPLIPNCSVVRYDAMYEHRITGERVQFHHLIELNVTDLDQITGEKWEKYRAEASKIMNAQGLTDNYARLENFEQLIPLPPGLKIARYV
jgi:hypothetical protein